MKKKSIIISLTEFTRDIRIFKTARSLNDYGVDVTVLSCYADNSLPREEKYIGISLNRITPLGSFLLGLSRSGKPQGSAPSIVRKSPVFLEIGGLCNIFFFIVVQIRIFFYLLPQKFDYCHTNDWDTLLVGYLYSRFRSCTWVHDSHEIYAEQDPDFPVSFQKLVRFSEAILFRRVDHLITVNHSIAAYFMDEYSVLSPVVIYNCPLLEVNESRNDAGIVKIVYVGLYEKNRGLEELVESISSIDAALYLQGFGSLEMYLRGRVIDKGLQGKVFFIDPVPGTEIVSSILGYDIGILPYKPVCLNNYYASPNKLFEYMMAGLAVVSVDIPEVHNLIGECRNGLLYNSEDNSGLIEEVKVLVKNPTLIAQMKKASLNYSRSKYYWEKQAEKILDIYCS